MKKFKKMREYTHEELINIIVTLTEKELLELSAKCGGNPVLLRMVFDPRVTHIPIIQPGSAIIIRNPQGEILLQERTDRNQWGLPGGCQDLGECLEDTAVREAFEETGIKLNRTSLILIDTLSGASRKNIYPSGDIVYNNTSLYLADIEDCDIENLKGDSETKSLRFFDPEKLPENFMDPDLVTRYIQYRNQESNILKLLKKCHNKQNN